MKVFTVTNQSQFASVTQEATSDNVEGAIYFYEREGAVTGTDQKVGDKQYNLIETGTELTTFRSLSTVSPNSKKLFRFKAEGDAVVASLVSAKTIAMVEQSKESSAINVGGSGTDPIATHAQPKPSKAEYALANIPALLIGGVAETLNRLVFSPATQAAWQTVSAVAPAVANYIRPCKAPSDQKGSSTDYAPLSGTDAPSKKQERCASLTWGGFFRTTVIAGAVTSVSFAARYGTKAICQRFGSEEKDAEQAGLTAQMTTTAALTMVGNSLRTRFNR